MTQVVITVKSTMKRDELYAISMRGIENFRLNCAHLSKEQITDFSAMIREASEKSGVRSRIFTDLPGTKARIWYSQGKRLHVKPGDKLEIYDSLDIQDNKVLQVSGKELFQSIREGDILSIKRRGNLRLLVEKRYDRHIAASCISEGLIGWGYHITAEGKYLPARDLSEADYDILPYVLRAKPDFVCASFADTPEVMKKLREAVTDWGSSPALLAKIESPAALDNLKSILELSDGAVIGRDDLSSWLDHESLIRATAQVIKECRERKLIAVPASNYFSSICENEELSEENISDIKNVLELGPDYIYCNETNKTNCWSRVIKEAEKLQIC